MANPLRSFFSRWWLPPPDPRPPRTAEEALGPLIRRIAREETADMLSPHVRRLHGTTGDLRQRVKGLEQRLVVQNATRPVSQPPVSPKPGVAHRRPESWSWLTVELVDGRFVVSAHCDNQVDAVAAAEALARATVNRLTAAKLDWMFANVAESAQRDAVSTTAGRRGEW